MAARWDRKGPFIVDGEAGSGKSTILRAILEEMGGTYALLGPTGKAARVITAKTGMPAQTIHSFMYKPVDDQRGKLQKELGDLLRKDPLSRYIDRIHQELKELEGGNGVNFSANGVADDVDIIAIDERSMVGQHIADDLDALRVPLLLVGDEYQLPPVKDTPGWSHLRPRITLDECKRTNSSSWGITDAANRLRKDGFLRTDGPGFTLAKKGSLDWEAYAGYDVVLCGRNETRRIMNKGLRRELGFSGLLPAIGEKLVCLANTEHFGVSNGDSFRLKEIAKETKHTITIDCIRDDGEEVLGIVCWKDLFHDDSGTMIAPRGLGLFTFGYAMTVHKFQGSEAPRVALCDDLKGGDKSRWLYTGVTRASQEVVVVR